MNQVYQTAKDLCTQSGGFVAFSQSLERQLAGVRSKQANELVDVLGQEMTSRDAVVYIEHLIKLIGGK